LCLFREVILGRESTESSSCAIKAARAGAVEPDSVAHRVAPRKSSRAKGGTPTPLKYAVSDVTDLAVVLKKSGYEVMVLSDARPFETATGTLVSVSKLYEELEQSFAGTKLVLIDDCRNDPTPGRGRSGIDVDGAPPPQGVDVLFRCNRGQRAYLCSPAGMAAQNLPGKI